MNELPEISVVRGAPTEEELAAAIAVVQAAIAQAEADSQDSVKPSSVSRWNRNHGMLRSTLVAGNGQWSASYRSGLN